MQKRKLIRNIERLSSLDLIEFFKIHFEISEENLTILNELEIKINTVPLLLLLSSLGEKNHTGKNEYLIRRTIDKQGGVGKELDHFLDELLSTGKFADGSAKKLLDDITYGLSLYSKGGKEWLVEVLLNAMEKSDDEFLAKTSIDLIQQLIHFAEYEPFLEAIKKSRNTYVIKKSLENLRRIEGEGIICDYDVNIKIINSLIESLEDSRFVIRWETSKTIHAWLRNLKIEKYNEEFKEKGIDIEYIEIKLLKIMLEFPKKILQRLELKGTEEEKKIIKDFREKLESTDYGKIARRESKKEAKEREKRQKELLEEDIITGGVLREKFGEREARIILERYMLEEILKKLEEVEILFEKKKELKKKIERDEISNRATGDYVTGETEEEKVRKEKQREERKLIEEGMEEIKKILEDQKRFIEKITQSREEIRKREVK